MRPAHSTHADLALVDHQTGLANGVQTQESPGVRQQGNEGDEADQQGVTDLLALVTLTLSCPIGPAAGFPAMSSNVPFLMKDVILLAVSLDLLRQDVAASRNNEHNMQRETPPGRRPVALCSFHGGMNEVVAAHQLPRRGMGEFAHRPGSVAWRKNQLSGRSRRPAARTSFRLRQRVNTKIEDGENIGDADLWLIRSSI
jgi:hypothetical protein